MAEKAIYKHHERDTSADLITDLEVRELGIDPEGMRAVVKSETLGTPIYLASEQSLANTTGGEMVGVDGIPSIVPTGGGVGDPSTLQAMLEGLKGYVDSVVASVGLLAFFDLWDADATYEPNMPVAIFASDTGQYYLAISNQSENINHDPIEAISEPTEWWTVYGYTGLSTAPQQKPLSQIICMILNTKANA